MSEQADLRPRHHHKRHISKRASKKMMQHGQKSLAHEIEHAVQCCEDRDCQYMTWPRDQCRRCGKTCPESCYYFLGAVNAQNRNNRWYEGEVPVRKLSKDEKLPVSVARYLLLQDCALGKQGDYVELRIKTCWSKPK